MTSVKAIGFDLDGTLYDEFEFISQVYIPISKILADVVGGHSNHLYARLIHRWKEKGSSYNKIFEEILIEAKVPEMYKSLAVAQCLNAYRNYQPLLNLPVRVENLLDYFSARYSIFMVTDGGEKLQRAKIAALGLSRWFSIDNISISGCVGPGISKPDTRMKNPINLLQAKDLKPSQVIYFGDRDIDANFAKNCGYRFVKVSVMNPVSNNLA